MLRGGSWNNNASNCRVVNRNNNHPDNRNNNVGFRLSNTVQYFPGSGWEGPTGSLYGRCCCANASSRVASRVLVNWDRIFRDATGVVACYLGTTLVRPLSLHPAAHHSTYFIEAFADIGILLGRKIVAVVAKSKQDAQLLQAEIDLLEQWQSFFAINGFGDEFNNIQAMLDDPVGERESCIFWHPLTAVHDPTQDVVPLHKDGIVVSFAHGCWYFWTMERMSFPYLAHFFFPNPRIPIRTAQRLGHLQDHFSQFGIGGDEEGRIALLKGLLLPPFAKGIEEALLCGFKLYGSSVQGLSFLGARIFPQLIRIKPDNLRRATRRMKRRRRQLLNEEIDLEAYYRSMNSYWSYLAQFDSVGLRRALLEEISGNHA